MNIQNLLIFGAVVVVVWCVVIYFWPRLMLSAYRRALLTKGFGDGPIPVNTLHTQPQGAFCRSPPRKPPRLQKSATSGREPRMSPDGRLARSRQGPQVLHVPDMADRYYSVQFTDPSNNTNFAYVGKRTTGTQAGDYLVSGPGWKGQVPGGMTQIASPNKSVLVLGRVLVESDSDLPTAYALTKQIQLTPLSHWQPGLP